MSTVLYLVSGVPTSVAAGSSLRVQFELEPGDVNDVENAIISGSPYVSFMADECEYFVPMRNVSALVRERSR